MSTIYISTPGKEEREHSENEVRSLWEQGVISPGTLVWKEGMNEWKPIEEVFAPISSPPVRPPLPPAPQQQGAAMPAGVSPDSWGVGSASTPHTIGEVDVLEPTYAGFWKRVLAFLIDLVVLNLVGFIAGFIMGFLVVTAAGSFDEETLRNLGLLLSIAIGWIYFAVMESSSLQATLGKMALQIKVTDLAGDRISFSRATSRYFSKFISSLLLCIGYLMVAYTLRKQGLHDLIAGCLVAHK